MVKSLFRYAFAATILQVSLQAKLVEEINVSNWLERFEFAQKPNESSYTKWHSLDSAVVSGTLGDGKTSMFIRPESRKVIDPVKDEGRESAFLLSKKGIVSGMAVVDIEHIPEPGCGSRAALHLFGENEKGQHRLYMVDLQSWDPVNQISLKEGKLSKLPTASCTAMDSAEGSGFATAWNKKGGIRVVARWTPKEAKVWLDTGKTIKEIQPVDGKAPAVLEEARLGPAFWSNKICEKQVLVSSALTSPEHFGPMHMKLGFFVSFCEREAISRLGKDKSAAKDVKFTNTCKAVATDCKKLVAERPFDYKDTFWAIKSVWFYED